MGAPAVEEPKDPPRPEGSRGFPGSVSPQIAAGPATLGPAAPHSRTVSLGTISAISGATAGLVSGIVVCPLDVVKTKLQIQGFYVRTPGATHQPLYNGVLGTMRAIVAEDGVRGLYRGLTPLLVGYLPTWALYFYVYKRMQRFLGPESGLRGGLTAAVAAGACSSIATNPVWMIKTRMMAQSRHTSWQYSGFLDAARSIYKYEGVRAFYSGLGSALFGLPHVAIHFPLYESLKARFRRTKALDNTWGILLASILSKIVASSITYPHEVVRARNQMKVSDHKYRGVWRTVRTLFREEGWRAFYAGLGANICRAVPASAMTLVTFEVVSHRLRAEFGVADTLPENEAPRYRVASAEGNPERVGKVTVGLDNDGVFLPTEEANSVFLPTEEANS